MFRHPSKAAHSEPNPPLSWNGARKDRNDATYFFRKSMQPLISKPVPEQKHVSFPRDYRKGERVFRQGDTAYCVYAVIHGDLILHHCDEDGKEQVIDFIGAGELTGLTCSRIHDCTLECLTDCLIQEITVTGYHRLITACGQETALLELAGSISDRHMRHATMMGRRSALERVSRFLLDRCAYCRHGPFVALPMSRAHIANYLGLVTESVSRALTKLERLELIQRAKPHYIAIRDPSALDRLANGNSPDCFGNGWDKANDR